MWSIIIFSIILISSLAMGFYFYFSRQQKKQHIKHTTRRTPSIQSTLGKNPLNEISTFIAIHVVANKEAPFNGYELMQTLLANELIYGEKLIFHRYDAANNKKVLFSVASMHKPGTFDLSAMGSFSCAGLTLFMPINKVEEPQKVFELLLETAYQLSEDLQGTLLNQERQVLEENWINQVRTELQKIKKAA